jgi:hypothetical protein
VDAAQRYPGGAGVVVAGPKPGAGGVVGARVGVIVSVVGPSGPDTTVVDGVIVTVRVVGPSGPGTTVVVGVTSEGDVVVVSVGLVVVVVVVVGVTASLGLRTWVRGTQV